MSDTARFLLNHFDRLAEAPGGIAKLRTLILQLGVEGKLLLQNPADEPVAKLIERVQAEKKRMRAAKLIPPEKDHPAFEGEEIPFPIPASWSWQRLSAITHTFGQKVPDHRFTYIDVGAIDNKRGIISEPTVLEAADAPSRARKIIRKGAVIYSTVRPYLLNTCVIATDFKPEPIASTAFTVLNPHADISAHYLHYYLRSQPFISYVEDKMKGQAYPAINDGDMSVAPIPVPPLAEQRRIVAKVDELMGMCDALEAAQRERETVRTRLRTSTLAQLTASEAGSKSATTFVLQHLAPLTSTPEDIVPLRYLIVHLAATGQLTGAAKNAVAAQTTDFNSASDPQYPIAYGVLKPGPQYPGGTRLIKSQHIRDWQVASHIQDTISPELDAEFKRTKIKGGEVLLNLVGASIGRSAVISDEHRGANVTRAVAVITPKKSVAAKYLVVVLTHIFTPERISDLCAGTAQPVLNIGVIRKLSIWLPPLAEQCRIVAKVDELMAVLDTLEAALTTARATSEKLLATTVARLHAA